MNKMRTMRTKQIKALLQALSVETQPTRQKDYTAWANKIGIEQRGLNVVLPTKQGNKTYEAVKLKNGKVAVYCKGGNVLKYAWN
jgi:hypothetical protein